MNPIGMVTVERGKTVVESAAEAIIGYISARQLQSGDRLPPERELVEMLGISRLPLRESLGILKGLGVVEAQHGKGIFVKKVDLESVFQMLSPLLKMQADIKAKQIIEARLHLGAMPVLFTGPGMECRLYGEVGQNRDTGNRGTDRYLQPCNAGVQGQLNQRQ